MGEDGLSYEERWGETKRAVSPEGGGRGGGRERTASPEGGRRGGGRQRTLGEEEVGDGERRGGGGG